MDDTLGLATGICLGQFCGAEFLTVGSVLTLGSWHQDCVGGHRKHICVRIGVGKKDTAILRNQLSRVRWGAP